MSYFGYADFDRPIDFEGGRIYYPYGGGPFLLTPDRCAVASADDGRVNFRLDLIRDPANRHAYAIVEVRLTAEYAADRALAHLRQNLPGSSLSRAVLTDWTVRLAPGPIAAELPPELLGTTSLASNGLGSARLVLPLSIDSGLLLESLARDPGARVPAIAEAWMEGISPRVPAVVRFRSSNLLAEIEGLVAEDRTMGRQTLIDYFTRDTAALPMEVTGFVSPDRRSAFAETMADRVIDRFGATAPSSVAALDPRVTLSPNDDRGETDVIWSLSQPFLTERSIVREFDLLADVRHRIQIDAGDSFAIFHTAAALPPLGESKIMVFCNLPTERIGVVSLGATLTFAPVPPWRPHARTVTVEFDPATDIALARVQLAPGEALNYTYSTFAVIADEHGVRQVDGPEIPGSGSPLRLSTRDFPVDFGLVEIGPDLAQVASIAGTCRYERDGKEHRIPFTLDAGRLAVSIALPRGQTLVNLQCDAIARSGNGVVNLDPVDSPRVRLGLSSFPRYGAHEAEIECDFEGRAGVYAIDLLADSDDGRSGAVSVLAFTPSQPRRRFAWFASSPFSPGFSYRPHVDDGNPAAWRGVPWPVDHLTVRPEEALPAEAVEVTHRSERAARRLGVKGNGRKSESARPAGRASSEATPAAPPPLSPEPEPTDLLLYRDPSDPSKLYYLPRYALGVQTVSGRQEYWMTMAQQATTSTLTVHLTKGPAEPIADAARDADELPHDIGVRLEFLSSPPYTARKTLEFDEVTRRGAEVTAAMRFVTLEERDDVYRALTDPSRDARLLVRRSFDVALPQVPPPPPVRFDNRGNLAVIDVLPPRPKPIWFARKLIDEPLPDGAGSKTNVSPLNANVATTFVAAPVISVTATSAARLNLALAGPNLAATKVLATRFESTAVAMTANKALLWKNSGKFVIDDWVGKTTVASLPVPVLAFTGQEAGDGFVRCRLRITNWSEFSSDFFQASPDLPPCGKNTNASRTWVNVFDAATNARLYGFCALSSPSDLAELWFSAPPGKVPASVYVQLEDRRAKVVRKSNAAETTRPQNPDPSYVPAHRELDDGVDPQPFAFLPGLHDYIFQGIQPGGGDSRLVRFRVPWLNTFSTYLQDASRPEVVYFFPDGFRIARRSEAPFTPFITVRVAGQADGTDANVVFDYIVAPHVNPDRLLAARAALLADPRFGASNVQFQPFATGDVRFFIDRPTQQGTVREERTGVSLVLQGSLKDTLVMALPDFQLLFDAMHRDTASLFLGRVEIDVPGENVEVIPFSARVAELEGNLFAFSAVANADGGLDVALANAIESPLRIDALPATVSRGGQTVEATIQGLTLPVASLNPESTLRMTITPTTPLNGSGAPDVTFNLDSVTVLPDPAKILDSILDRTTLEYYDTITVKSVATIFEPRPDQPQDQIVAILVEFEGGGTAELNGSTLEATVRIDYPIDDVILRRAVNTAYRYIVTVVRADGRQERGVQPRQRSARTFFVSVDT